MKKTGRILLTAALIGATVMSGCNDKNTKEEKMKEPSHKEDKHFHNEPVCIYGPPEMLGALTRIDDSPMIDPPETPDEPTTDKTDKKD